MFLSATIQTAEDVSTKRAASWEKFNNRHRCWLQLVILHHKQVALWWPWPETILIYRQICQKPPSLICILTPGHISGGGERTSLLSRFEHGDLCVIPREQQLARVWFMARSWCHHAQGHSSKASNHKAAPHDLKSHAGTAWGWNWWLWYLQRCSMRFAVDRPQLGFYCSYFQSRGRWKHLKFFFMILQPVKIGTFKN